MVVISGLGTLTFSIVMPIMGFSISFADFTTFFVEVFFVFFGLQIASITQILVISSPSESASKGTGASTSGTASFRTGTEMEE